MIKQGSIIINISHFARFLNSLTKKEYTTFELLRLFMSYYNVNKKQPAGSSWNASFGKILMKFSKLPTNTILQHVSSNNFALINSDATHTAKWQIV